MLVDVSQVLMMRLDNQKGALKFLGVLIVLAIIVTIIER